MDSYINYTNKAILSNNIDYFNIRQMKDKRKSVLLWNRKALSKIENDKNHYLKIDIPHTKRVYTMLVKSSDEIDDYKKYKELLTIEKARHNVPDNYIVKHSSNKSFNDETQKFYDNYLKNGKKLLWGIYQWDYMASDALDVIERHLEHKFGILLLYSEFEEKYNPENVREFLDKAYCDGRIVELTLQPKREHPEGNDLYRVLDGYYDDFLQEYAKDVAEFSHPVLFRLCNEMNGDWCEYSGYRMSLDAELYRELYRYVYNIFSQYNADNVIWVWNPNGKSFPDFEWNYEGMYYPGDKYVDVLGLTLYNTGDFYEGEKWTEFDELYRPLYEKALKEYDMPFIITEFACARQGGNKEEWTRKMLELIEYYPNIKAAIWWNGADFTENIHVSRAYYINDSVEMLDIFKEYFVNK